MQRDDVEPGNEAREELGSLLDDPLKDGVLNPPPLAPDGTRGRPFLFSRRRRTPEPGLGVVFQAATTGDDLPGDATQDLLSGLAHLDEPGRLDQTRGADPSRQVLDPSTDTHFSVTGGIEVSTGDGPMSQDPIPDD